MSKNFQSIIGRSLNASTLTNDPNTPGMLTNSIVVSTSEKLDKHSVIDQPMKPSPSSPNPNCNTF